MSDDASIRRANLRSLRLDPPALVARAGKSNSYWRDLLTLESKSFGEKAARSIEASLELPRGWLDVPHGLAEAPKLKQLPSVRSETTVDQAFAAIAPLLAQVPRDERQYLATQLSLWVLQGGPADMLPPILRMLEPEVQSTRGLSKQAK